MKKTVIFWIGMVAMCLSMFHSARGEWAAALAATNLGVMALFVLYDETETERKAKLLDIKGLDDFNDSK